MRRRYTAGIGPGAGVLGLLGLTYAVFGPTYQYAGSTGAHGSASMVQVGIAPITAFFRHQAGSSLPPVSGALGHGCALGRFAALGGETCTSANDRFRTRRAGHCNQQRWSHCQVQLPSSRWPWAPPAVLTSIRLLSSLVWTEHEGRCVAVLWACFWVTGQESHWRAHSV